MHHWKACTLAAVLCASVSLTTALVADESPQTRGHAEQAAFAPWKQIGGVRIHCDDRLPDRPVVLVEFTNHPSFQEEWLRSLTAFPHLSGLELGGTAMTDQGLRHVKKLRSLETLTLVGTDVTDEGLAELMGLKNLRALDVRGTRVTASGANVLRRFLPELEVRFGPLPGGGAAPALPPDAGSSVATSADQPAPATPKAAIPSAAKIKELRQKAMERTLPGENDEEPEGWSKSWHDPLKVVDLFKPLRVSKGYLLRAYLHREDGNGSGVVWAMPADAEYPEPKDCPRLEHHFLKAPKPWDALDDTMEAIEGDDSAWSYLAASLLRRELGEFGALWHGIQWGTHTLLDDSPWAGGPPRDDELPGERPLSRPGTWQWFEARPKNWAPQVRLEADRAIVTFYTYTAHARGGEDGEIERERIIRHTDTYRRGKYRPMTVEKKIAQGPDALAF